MNPRLHLALAGGTESDLTVEIKRAVFVWAWNTKGARVIVPEFVDWVGTWRPDLVFVDKRGDIHVVEVKISAGDLKKDLVSDQDIEEWRQDTEVWKTSLRSLKRTLENVYGVCPHIVEIDHVLSWPGLVAARPHIYDARRDPRYLAYLDDKPRCRRPEQKFYLLAFRQSADYLWIAVPEKLANKVPDDFGLLVYKDGEVRARHSPSGIEVQDKARRLAYLYKEGARLLCQRLVQLGGGQVGLGYVKWSGEEDHA